MKEKLIVAVGVRIMLHAFYGIQDLLEREEEVAEILDKTFGSVEDLSDGDIDEMMDQTLEVYSKLAYHILEENNGEQ